MKFRDIDYSQDIEKVVDLIQNNLRSNYSREILEWKHLHNPFGPSHSMVAIENEEIIGVAFYMRYNFVNDRGDVIKCLRPFDACTDFNHRGKGIFKSLITKILEKYKDDYDFLLANPNPNSYPEFLKLGWREPEINFYKIGVISPFFNLSKNKISRVNLETVKDDPIIHQDFFISGNSIKFLKWRYRQENYKTIKYETEKKQHYLIYRIEKKNNLNAIIVCDYYGDLKSINEVIKGVCRLEKIYIIYYLENQITNNINTFVSKSHKKAIKVFKTNNFKLPSNLVISLGDMEGRL